MMDQDPQPQNQDLRSQLTQQITSLNLTPNQQQLVDNTLGKAVSDFPDNERAAWLFTKKKLNPVGFSPEEQEELAQYGFFPEEHPQKRKENPIRDKKVIIVSNHKIEIVNLAPGVDLDKEHLRQIKEVFEKVYKISPKLAANFLKLFIILKPGAEKEEYGPNGYITERQVDNWPRGIVLTQEGYRTDISHRISGVNNLQGTVAHEIGHLFFNLYPQFYGKFFQGYHWVGDNQTGEVIDDDWEKGEWDEEYQCYSFIHKESGYKTRYGYVPKDIKLLSTRYACLHPDEDFSESFVAWLYERPLDPQRKAMFDEWRNSLGNK